MISSSYIALGSLAVAKSILGVPVSDPSDPAVVSTSVLESAANSSAVFATVSTSTATSVPNASSGATFTSTPADPNVSKLNGMSTSQLAMYVGIGLAAIVAIIAGWFFWKRYKAKKDNTPGDDSEDDDEEEVKRPKLKRSKGKDSDDDYEEKGFKSREREVASRKHTDEHEYSPQVRQAPGALIPHGERYSVYVADPSARYNEPLVPGEPGYEAALRHNRAMDVYPVDPAFDRAPRNAPAPPQSDQRVTYRKDTGGDSTDYDSSDDSESETEEERKRKIRRDAKKTSRK
ncbi:hypothetical protein QFC21_007359 [Naganishia friedmannii]|uniref:Uncharacterized protein n=1 Tax=Naganishia friedmannii TaxID=89922 RepID=A0ACC2UV19_9TREE|nr:hypothetical protein QFC21_007359 [Naganishia friedmannii]